MWQRHRLIKSSAKTGDTNIFIQMIRKEEKEKPTLDFIHLNPVWERRPAVNSQAFVFVVNSIPQVFL